MLTELLVSQVTLALNQMNDFVHKCLTHRVSTRLLHVEPDQSG